MKISLGKYSHLFVKYSQETNAPLHTGFRLGSHGSQQRFNVEISLYFAMFVYSLPGSKGKEEFEWIFKNECLSDFNIC